jgi:glycosyltransferase involved in cell wall biosynthesis
MNILHIIPTLSLRGGGGDRACYELAQAQASLGNQVTILTFLSEYDFIDKPEDLNFTIVRCFKKKNSILGALGWSKEYNHKLEEILISTDLVHIHSLWRLTNYFAYKKCIKLNKHFIIQPHGSLEPWRLNYKKYRKKIWYHLFEEKALKRALFLIAESAKDKNHILASVSSNEVVIIPCGSSILDMKHESLISEQELRISYSIDKNKKIILYLGRIDVHKGLDILIKALGKLKDELESHVLLIVGPDYASTTKKLQSLIEKLNLTEKIIFAPPIYDDTKKIALFKMSDFFVLPSYSENFGITVIEALATETPVLVSSETAWAHLEEKQMAIVTKPEIDDLTQKLKQMISMNTAEKDHMVRKAKDYVYENYSWRELAKKLTKSYEEIKILK